MPRPGVNDGNDAGRVARLIMDIIMVTSLFAGIAIWISWAASH